MYVHVYIYVCVDYCFFVQVHESTGAYVVYILPRDFERQAFFACTEFGFHE